MRLVTFEVGGRRDFGVVSGEGIVALAKRLGCGSLKEALGRLDEIRSFETQPADHALDAVTLLPPIPDPERILCVGLNYLTHLKETGREQPERPMIFTRFASSQVGHGQALVRPRISEKFDYEGELAVVIGKTCRYVPAAEAFSVVAGYACYNDGSIRDWQRHSTQFIPGKNFPQSGAFGPWLATRDAVGELGNRSLVTRLNGEEMQRATIDDLVFDIPTLIEYCSSFTTLSPGDVIVTGTTGGVGAYRTPPAWMKQGDVVEIEIEGVGKLVNPVVDEA